MTQPQWTREQRDAVAQERRRKRMEVIDSMPPEIRALTHEYGWTVVDSFLRCGVTQPKRIRHLVETVLNEFSPTRGPVSSQGTKPDYRGWTPRPENAA